MYIVLADYIKYQLEGPVMFDLFFFFLSFSLLPRGPLEEFLEASIPERQIY